MDNTYLILQFLIRNALFAIIFLPVVAIVLIIVISRLRARFTAKDDDPN